MSWREAIGAFMSIDASIRDSPDAADVCAAGRGDVHSSGDNLEM